MATYTRSLSATVGSDDTPSRQKVILMDEDTFAGGTNGWTLVNGSRDTATGYDDSYSLYSSNNNTQTQAYKTFVAGGIQATTVEFYFRETSNSHGSAIRLFNSDGYDELVVACDNPQLDVYDANGWTELYAGNGYTRWIRHTLTFDWATATYDLEWEDYQAGEVRTFTDRPLRHGTDIEQLEFSNYAGQEMVGDSAIDSWYDLFRLNAPGGLITGTVTDDDGVAMGSEDVEVLNGTNGQIEQSVTTASDGSFETQALSNGEYDLHVRKPVYDTANMQDIQISGDDALGLDVTLPATVYETTTDSSGYYSHQLPVSVQDQIADAAQYGPAEKDVFVLNGPKTVDYTLVVAGETYSVSLAELVEFWED